MPEATRIIPIFPEMATVLDESALDYRFKGLWGFPFNRPILMTLPLCSSPGRQAEHKT